LNNSAPLGNTSLRISHSTDILPGCVKKRFMDIAIAIDSKLINIPACLSNGPPANPGDSYTIRVAPIISIIKMAVVILVNTPTIRKMPPMTSRNAMGKTNSGKPKTTKNLIGRDIFKLGNPATINAIPARIRIGRGPNISNFFEIISI
jgi:hypothetical protein